MKTKSLTRIVLKLWIPLAIFVTLLAFAWAKPPEKGDMKQFIKNLENIETELLSTLREDAIWQDPDKKEHLIELLELAKALRSPKLASLLVKHIAYSPVDEREKGELDVRQRYPVFSVLEAVGVPSVSLVVEQLKKIDPDDLIRGGQRDNNLLLRLLVSVYDQGGHGKEIAKRRIELEMMTATDKEKGLLNRAVQHPALKNDEK